jgi:nucleoside-diphosphate kinase
MTNLTFGIIKPDAVRAGHTGSIIQRILDGGFKIRGLKLIHMTRREAFTTCIASVRSSVD